MADIPQVPEWLARKISAFIARTPSGQATLSWTQHRIASFDLREVGKIRDNERDEIATTPR